MSAAYTSTSKNTEKFHNLNDPQEEPVSQFDEEVRKTIADLSEKVSVIQMEQVKTGLELHGLLALLQEQMKAMNEKMQQMITRTEFAPIKLLVYGFTATVLSGALGAILSLVFIHRG